jgi:transcriptional regulator with XRE-family HTH domain
MRFGEWGVSAARMGIASKTTDPCDAAIGARIRLRRRMLGLTQTELASALGVTFQQVQKYEKGTNRVAGSRLPVLARRLECSVSYLLGESEGNGETHDEQTVVWLAEDGALAMLEAYANIESRKARRAAVALMWALGAGKQGSQTRP